MFGGEADDAPLGVEHVLGVNEDVGRLPLETAERLVDVKAGVREGLFIQAEAAQLLS